MIYYHRINILEGIEINKTNEAKDGDVYHYCCFLDKSFKF